MVYCGDALTFSPLRTIELDAVEALLVDLEVAGERAVGLHGKRRGSPPSFSSTRPPGVFIVGEICSRTSVP